VLPKKVALARTPGGQTMLRRRQAIERSWQHVVDRIYATGGKEYDGRRLQSVTGSR
jgi:hypothetical protein